MYQSIVLSNMVYLPVGYVIIQSPHSFTHLVTHSIIHEIKSRKHDVGNARAADESTGVGSLSIKCVNESVEWTNYIGSYYSTDTVN